MKSNMPPCLAVNRCSNAPRRHSKLLCQGANAHALSGHLSYLWNILFCENGSKSAGPSCGLPMTDSVLTVLNASRPPKMPWVHAPKVAVTARVCRFMSFCRRLSMRQYTYEARCNHIPAFVAEHSVSIFISGERPLKAEITPRRQGDVVNPVDYSAITNASASGVAMPAQTRVVGRAKPQRIRSIPAPLDFTLRWLSFVCRVSVIVPTVVVLTTPPARQDRLVASGNRAYGFGSHFDLLNRLGWLERVVGLQPFGAFAFCTTKHTWCKP